MATLVEERHDPQRLFERRSLAVHEDGPCPAVRARRLCRGHEPRWEGADVGRVVHGLEGEPMHRLWVSAVVVHVDLDVGTGGRADLPRLQRADVRDGASILRRRNERRRFGVPVRPPQPRASRLSGLVGAVGGGQGDVGARLLHGPVVRLTGCGWRKGTGFDLIGVVPRADDHEDREHQQDRREDPDEHEDGRSPLPALCDRARRRHPLVDASAHRTPIPMVSGEGTARHPPGSGSVEFRGSLSDLARPASRPF
ncbi:MAG: hypothetical protein JRE18_07730 [Deltaproteobacteria bacterium]|nr:hypothetical protein [Deltaproteobacteria bacterium]